MINTTFKRHKIMMILTLTKRMKRVTKMMLQTFWKLPKNLNKLMKKLTLIWKETSKFTLMRKKTSLLKYLELPQKMEKDQWSKRFHQLQKQRRKHKKLLEELLKHQRKNQSQFLAGRKQKELILNLLSWIKESSFSSISNSKDITKKLMQDMEFLKTKFS